MSLKIQIPEVSPEYKEAIYLYLIKMNKDCGDDFYKYLNIVSGCCANVEISESMFGLGGVVSIQDLIDRSKGFELETIKEFAIFKKAGYSSGDFQHIFLDAFLCVMGDTFILRRNDANTGN